MPSVEVVRTFRFEAAHVLPWHAGKCSQLHGHSYRLDVHVEGPLTENGIVIDFSDLARVVDELVIARCDHRLLNDVLDNPTAERLALQALEWLVPVVSVTKLVLWETATSRVEVQP